MIIYAEIECLLYESNSLKEKRSLIKKVLSKIKNDFNVSVAELDYHDLWQRTKLGIVTISNEKARAEKVIQSVLKMIDTFPELERTITEIERV
ncbi:hypothetical protein HNQ35_001099 [Cerasibacillus quisquiliarum]|uniref:DUF503 domain-containing protein n=1 Tax=Cerasibacillus quisquiliarum TaxID=227865 RepID=A0A511UV47_9BACI|nr:DUF503 domain-containing protein [Cerasibacillus quisquiliarum]MBB5145898.1 hypothetical protein [Cerasibacillus quisquiliarum]GEN30469.1 hypothetical protein CQU01_07070 [Cerasibacillus quisquiliarum]